MDKRELFQSMINALTEFQIIGEFDNGDIILNFLPVASAKSCDFDYAIFHDKKWYKVVASEEDSKIEEFEQNDDTQETVLSILKEDSLKNGAMDLIDLSKHFITKTDEIYLQGELINKTIWIADTVFGKLHGLVINETEVVSIAIEIDSELHFHENYRDNGGYVLFCKIIKRYYDAFVRDEISKFEGLTSDKQKIKF